MKTTTRKVGSVLVVTTEESRLDSRSAINLKSSVLDLVKQGATDVVLNLSSVDFVDSTGLGAIVLTRKAVGNKGEVILTGVREPVMTMFRLTRTDALFRILQSVEEAIGLLEERGS